MLITAPSFGRAWARTPPLICASAAAGVTRYVFPNRWSSVAVLNSALKANPSDAHARLLLGRLLLNQLNVDEAAAQWQAARKINPAFPELVDLGQALMEVRKNAALVRSRTTRNRHAPDTPERCEPRAPRLRSALRRRRTWPRPRCWKRPPARPMKAVPGSIPRFSPRRSSRTRSARPGLKCSFNG